jgi:hypothetical protein
MSLWHASVMSGITMWVHGRSLLGMWHPDLLCWHLCRAMAPSVGSSSVGACAEASPDVHCLLEHTATHEARLRWEEMGARRYQEPRARTQGILAVC